MYSALLFAHSILTIFINIWALELKHRRSLLSFSSVHTTQCTPQWNASETSSLAVETIIRKLLFHPLMTVQRWCKGRANFIQFDSMVKCNKDIWLFWFRFLLLFNWVWGRHSSGRYRCDSFDERIPLCFNMNAPTHQIQIRRSVTSQWTFLNIDAIAPNMENSIIVILDRKKSKNTTENKFV